MNALRHTVRPTRQFISHLLFYAMSTLPNLLTKTEVLQATRVSDRTVERLVRRGAFPKPMRMGKCAYWEVAAVARWMEAKLEAQRSWTPKTRKRASPSA